MGRYTITPEREKQIDREQVEWVFGLTGGELNDTPWAGFAYNYNGVPEWAVEDFDRDTEYVTVVSTNYYVSTDETIEVDGQTWERVAQYTHSGECECPGQHDECNLVTRAQAALYPTWKSKRRKGLCVLCEERVGTKHGFIYLGGGCETVYRRVSADSGDES